MNAACDIIVSGHLCLDLIPDLDGVAPERLSLGGCLLESGPLRVATGGAVSNTGLALHRLGARVGLMASVGDDPLGKIIVDTLAAHHPRLAEPIAVQRGASSSYSVVLAPQKRDRTFLHFPGTNATFASDQLDYSRIAEAKIFHLGYPPLMPRLIAERGEELTDLYARVKSRGVVTSMDMVVPDPNGPSGRADWPGILHRVLPFVDVFLPSIDELLYMLRREDWARWRGDTLANITREYLHDLAGELLEMGAVVAGFKLGEGGVYLRTANSDRCERLSKLDVDIDDWRDRELYQPAYEVEVAGTTGAGDSAYAGFLAAMLKRLPPHACIQLASAVGACNVESIDATSGVRSWEETTARLESGWQTRKNFFLKEGVGLLNA